LGAAALRHISLLKTRTPRPWRANSGHFSCLSPTQKM